MFDEELQNSMEMALPKPREAPVTTSKRLTGLVVVIGSVMVSAEDLPLSAVSFHARALKHPEHLVIIREPTISMTEHFGGFLTSIAFCGKTRHWICC
jgi:hypothetical protein